MLQHQLWAAHCRLHKKVPLIPATPCLFVATPKMMLSPCLKGVCPLTGSGSVHGGWLAPSAAILPPSPAAAAQAVLDDLHCPLQQGDHISKPPLQYHLSHGADKDPAALTAHTRLQVHAGAPSSGVSDQGFASSAASTNQAQQSSCPYAVSGLTALTCCGSRT